jgi:hypothetical protein
LSFNCSGFALLLFHRCLLSLLSGVSHSEDDISRARCPTYTVKEPLKEKPRLHAEVLECFEKRKENQMEQKLYGVPLYLNMGRFLP